MHLMNHAPVNLIRKIFFTKTSIINDTITPAMMISKVILPLKITHKEKYTRLKENNLPHKNLVSIYGLKDSLNFSTEHYNLS